MPACCGIKGLRKIKVGNVVVGLTGVDAILEALLVEGWSPDKEGLGQTIIVRLREGGNYIERNVEDAYSEALRALFADFYEANSRPKRS